MLTFLICSIQLIRPYGDAPFNSSASKPRPKKRKKKKRKKKKKKKRKNRKRKKNRNRRKRKRKNKNRKRKGRKRKGRSKEIDWFFFTLLLWSHLVYIIQRMRSGSHYVSDFTIFVIWICLTYNTLGKLNIKCRDLIKTWIIKVIYDW